MLCLLALRDVDARNFLLTQDWQEVIAETPGSEMLARILESDLRPDDPASLNRFMSSLAAGRGVVSLSLAFAKNAAQCRNGGA